MDTVLRSDGRARVVLVGLGLAIASLISQQVMPLPVAIMEPAVIFAPAEASRGGIFALLVLNFVGMALVGALYLAITGRGWAYVDIRFPTRRGWKYIGAGAIGSIGFIIAVQAVVIALDLPSAPNQIMEFIGDDPTMVLVILVIVFLFNAPAEEFLFRNVIQKRLYDGFSRPGAIGIASAIFALIHLPAYSLTLDGSLAPAEAIAVSLVVVFGGSVIFGALYARTDNLFVPIAAHAALNAFQFAVLYLFLISDNDASDVVPSLVLEISAVLGLG